MTRRILIPALLALLLALPVGTSWGQQADAPAQPPTAAAQEQPAAEAPTADTAGGGEAVGNGYGRARNGRAGTFTLEARGLDIDNLLKFYSDTFRLTVVKDPNCTGPVTVICPQPVGRDAALSILNGVLEVRGFTSILSGSLLKVVPLARAVQSKVDLRVGAKPDTLALDQVITQIVPLQQAQAGNMQRELTPLVSPGASIIASPASNTLIITDTASNVTRLLDIIERLDSQSPNGTQVFPLQYADATALQSIVSRLVTTQGATGGTTSQAARVPWEARLFGRRGGSSTGGGSSSSATVSQGLVLADTRTNSLIVTAPPDKMQVAETVIKSLDKPVPYESTVFVYPLQSAKAADLAATLSQSFGRTGASRTTTSAAARRTTGTQNRNAGNRSNPGLRQGSNTRSSLDEGPLEIASAGKGEANADLEVAQAQGGNRTSTYSRPRTSTGGTVGRGSDGRVVNVVSTGSDVTVIADTNTNSLIINAPPEQMESVKELIQNLDQVPVQVMIEAMIVEMTLDQTNKLGVEFTWKEENHFGNSDLTGTVSQGFGLDPKGQGLRYSVLGTNFSAVLSALKQDQRANILSTPRIFTANNRPAEINISQQVPYIISTRETDNGTITYNYGYMDVGIVLNVTPQVSSGGTVNMEVSQEANDLLGYSDFNAPIVARRSAQTSVSVQDGQTVVLGGIMKESRNETTSKVPLLGDLPLIGNLFRKKETIKGKTELLVFLTPRVVRNAAEAGRLADEQRKQLKSNPHLQLPGPGSLSPTPPLLEEPEGARPGSNDPGRVAPGVDQGQPEQGDDSAPAGMDDGSEAGDAGEPAPPAGDGGGENGDSTPVSGGEGEG